jgi:hypothetical protein
VSLTSPLITPKADVAADICVLPLGANFRHGHLPQSRLRIAVLSATLARQLGEA